MESVFDPNWYANSLGMPLLQVLMFPIGIFIILFMASRTKLINHGTLVSNQEPKFVVFKFLTGFLLGGLGITLTIAVYEQLTNSSISPLPEYFRIDTISRAAR